MTAALESRKRLIKMDDLDPNKITPHGDRYLLEMMEVDETTDSGIVLVRDTNDPKAQEHDLGFAVGVILAKGGGHRLDVADQAVPITTTEQKPEGLLVAVDPETKSGVMMIPSTVPMPFSRGDVVICGKYVGTEMKINGVEHKIVTQAHIIAHSGKRILLDQLTILPATVPCGNDPYKENGEASEDADDNS
jgi:co-chaperonin GroES (HSP10)